MKAAGIGYCRKEDWDRYRAAADDRDTLHETWEEWHKDFQSAKKNLRSLGIKVKEVPVDVDKLMAWCEEHGVKNNGQTRAQFVVSRAS